MCFNVYVCLQIGAVVCSLLLYQYYWSMV